MWKTFHSERSINKIFSLRWYPSNTGLYGVIAKLTADENFSREARLKKICSIFTLLGMFVMLLLFHLSLGDGQCSWNLNIIKAFQGPLPKKLETSRAKVQTLKKGGEKKSWCQQLVWYVERSSVIGGNIEGNIVWRLLVTSYSLLYVNHQGECSYQ